jgi:AraC-like DNA-binding protein
MLVQEKGTISGSEDFHPCPSDIAKKLLYYVVGCGVYFCEYGYRIEREDYGNYMLLHVTKGVLAVSTEDKTYLVKEGQVAFLNCHKYHTYYAKGFVSFLWIHLEGVNISDFYEEFCQRRDGIVLEGGIAKCIQKNMFGIISCYRNDLEIMEVEHSRLLYECLCYLTFAGEDEVSEESERNLVVETAKEYIRQNMEQNLSLNVVAGVVGLSPCHFSRVFKKETSYSPYEYVILVRLNKAKHLLNTTQKTIKEIAYEVGYGSESNFCNAFTAKIGISPMNFRKFKL